MIPSSSPSPSVSVLRTFALALALLLSAVAVPAEAVSDPTYQALRAARPDGRTMAITEPVTLTRDAYELRLGPGTVHLLAPAGGKTVGAIFLGEGSWRLDAATEDERRHLALLTGEDGFEVLRERFGEALLWFTDGTLAELEAALGAPVAGSPSPAALAAFDRALDLQRRDFESNLHLRVLQELLDTPESPDGLFLALLDGAELPPALLAVDSRGADALLNSLTSGEDTLLLVADDTRGGLWYASDRKEEVAAGKADSYKSRVDALHYRVDTTVAENADLTGSTTVRFVAMEPVRVLRLGLQPTLRVSGARFRILAEPGQAMTAGAEPPWTEVPFIQEHEEEDADLGVVLPKVLSLGTQAEVAVDYAGDEVLEDRGGGTFAVQARSSWYPNLGLFRDPASFELTYRLPEGGQVISVGQKVSEVVEGGRTVSTWRADRPIRVAGFNYGRFEAMTRQDQDSGVRVEVHTTPGTPDIIREINTFLRSARGDGSLVGSITGDSDSPINTNVSTGPASIGRINTEDLAEAAMADGLNALRIGHAYFGPLDQEHVAITQQEQWTFGQSWPSLIFMPYLSFLDGTQRMQLGMGAGVTDFVNQVGFHEMAHQWWGHQVGWDSYRDQWLSEGFAEFTAALAVQHTQGWGAYNQFWENAQELIGAKLGSEMPQYAAGPLTRGWRLTTHRSPAAYNVLTYSKGAFVVHMLRMMMMDPGGSGDARFIAMMQDFTSTYAGRTPSTRDFQRIVERHMTPMMNATGDGSMDWFFDQWVRGSQVPRLEADLDADRAGEDEAGNDQYRITGTIELADVSADFRAMVPIYAEARRGGGAAFLGNLAFIGPGKKEVDFTVPLPERPGDIVVNARHELLVQP